MDYTEFSREQLLARIKHLEILSHELLREREQDDRLEIAWTGNLGHWYWNVQTNDVVFNALKITTLGYDKSEIPESVPYQFFTDKLHPAIPRTMRKLCMPCASICLAAHPYTRWSIGYRQKTASTSGTMTEAK